MGWVKVLLRCLKLRSWWLLLIGLLQTANLRRSELGRGAARINSFLLRAPPKLVLSQLRTRWKHRVKPNLWAPWPKSCPCTIPFLTAQTHAGETTSIVWDSTYKTLPPNHCDPQHPSVFRAASQAPMMGSPLPHGLWWHQTLLCGPSVTHTVYSYVHDRLREDFEVDMEYLGKS